MKRIFLFLVLFFFCAILRAQICGTPGGNGPVDIPLYGPGNGSISMNTYFPAKANLNLPAGAKSMQVGAVPINDIYGNNFGVTAISAGDMLLVIQMQDATIRYTNDAFYGSNNDKAGNDGLGGTGYTSLGSTGKFEYVIAANAVSLAGGILTFRGSGAGRGTVNAYTNADATLDRGVRTFQVVRVPQYSSLTLTKDIEAPPFNGKAGGIIAFDVSGTMNMNGFQIDASIRGFRGGFGSLSAVNSNLSGGYVTFSRNSRGSGKGEGIAGTPRYLLDVYKNGLSHQADNQIEGLPAGSFGKGAPGNAGGGGNEFNAGGGGGGNGGAGGGGSGAAFLNDPGSFPNGGRPGSASHDQLTPDLSRLIMGGGGGSGQSDFDDSWGAVGGGAILINVGRIIGKGKILSNGGSGFSGFYDSGNLFNGASGGGAGGTVLLKVTNPDPSARLTIEAKGGNGGNSKSDRGIACGPGGGGGGGEVFCSLPPASVNVDAGKGTAGFVDGTNSHSFAEDGQDGYVVPFIITSLPPYLQGGGAFCYPELNTLITSVSPTGIQYAGATVSYQINTTNYSGGGTAAGVQIQVKLPPLFLYSSATVTYTGDAKGPFMVNNVSKDTNQLLFGNFNISPGDQVQLILNVSIPCGTPAGIYKSNAQVRYLDPTRTLADTALKITPVLNAFSGSNTSYETGIASAVAGSNYNGNFSTTSDVTVGFPNAQNEIKAPLITTFCIEGNPDPIKGESLAAGTDSYTYQWQSSVDGITYHDITGAVSKDYTPPLIQQNVYYRRAIAYAGCNITQSISNVVKLNIIKPPDAVDFAMPDICLKDASAKFTNQTQVTDGATTLITYLWDFGDPGSPIPTSTERDGQHVYTHTGEYLTKLTVFRNGCGGTVTKTFRVNGSAPKASFTVQNSTALCSGRDVLFEDHATVDFGEITRIDWYYDAENNPTVVETDNNPGLRLAGTKLYKHLYPVFHTPVTKIFRIRMVVYSGSSCIDEQTIPIILQAVPEVVFDALPASVCSFAAPFQLTQGKEASGLLPGKGIYTGDGVSASGMFDPAAAGAGKHTLTYSFTTDNGCTSVAKTQDIVVFGTPAVDAGKDQAVLEGGEVQLTGIVTAPADLALSYKWSPSTGLNRDDIINPVASPPHDLTYQLTVTTAQGCSATDDLFVHVLQNPEIPNTFTPNGDGINDEWNIKYLSSYPQAIVNVFNRYGGKVYSGTGATKSWDGKYNGEYVPVGVYYYVIDTKNGRKILSGSLTVLK